MNTYCISIIQCVDDSLENGMEGEVGRGRGSEGRGGGKEGGRGDKMTYIDSTESLCLLSRDILSV